LRAGCHFYLALTTELKGHGFRLPLCIDSGRRGTFGNIAASLSNQPLPFTADMQHRQITRAESGALNWKTALLLLLEPISQRHTITTQRAGDVDHTITGPHHLGRSSGLLPVP
jgi:hypothetical protein